MKSTAKHITRLMESAYSKGVLTVKVIQPGFNKSKTRFYPADTLKRDYKVFEGAKMFVDHQTDAEQKVRPEGSIKDWVANLRKVWVEKDGTIMGEAVVIDDGFKAKLSALASKNMLSQMGVSIRASGEVSGKEIEGVETSYVESLLSARSVDFVTFAGAGGEVLAMESNRPLPKPLAELNEVIAILTSSEHCRQRTAAQIRTEAIAMIAEKHERLSEHRLTESWKKRGLTPEAAKVAARVELKNRPASLPPATEWGSLLDNAFGRRR